MVAAIMWLTLILTSWWAAGHQSQSFPAVCIFLVQQATLCFIKRGRVHVPQYHSDVPRDEARAAGRGRRHFVALLRTFSSHQPQTQHRRTGSNKQLTLHWIFFTVHIIMFISVLVLCMHSLICCQSLYIVLVFYQSCSSVHTVHILISIWTFVYSDLRLLKYNLVIFSNVSIPHCDTTYSLCFTHSSSHYLMIYLLRTKSCFWYMACIVASKKIPHVIKCYSE